MHWENVFVGFGANLGDPVSQIREALGRLHGNPRIKSVRVSSLYCTEPVGWEKQDWFVNGVAWVRTLLDPRAMLEQLLAIESRMGRVRTIPAGPRRIDLDILTFGTRIMNEPNLQVPHPRMHERRFVLVPFCEIAPEVAHPVFGKRVADLLGELRDPKSVERMQDWEEAVWGCSAGPS